MIKLAGMKFDENNLVEVLCKVAGAYGLDKDIANIKGKPQHDSRPEGKIAGLSDKLMGGTGTVGKSKLRKGKLTDSGLTDGHQNQAFMSLALGKAVKPDEKIDAEDKAAKLKDWGRKKLKGEDVDTDEPEKMLQNSQNEAMKQG